MPKLSEIWIYPIKGLDGVSVPACMLTSSGALLNDRRFMLVDTDGNRLNGKRLAPLVHIRSRYDLYEMRVAFNHQPTGREAEFHLLHDARQIESFLASCLGFSVRMLEDQELGFPDDTEVNGPTIVSSASIAEVESWYKGMQREEVIRRFRVNLIVSGTAAFWEDSLFGKAGVSYLFTIGEIPFHGINPCQRCIVPTRNPWTGEVTKDFQTIFMKQREKKLPEWVEKDRFNHYYRFTTNTKLATASPNMQILVGDSIVIQKQASY
jgi:hypothetical protein